jgi:hypothetical protein
MVITSIYSKFETVMELDVVRRQTGQYMKALMRLQDDKTTEEDCRNYWNKIATKPASQLLSQSVLV